MVAEILRMENICKEYAGREEALHNACISIRCGEIHALMGKNGSGKTTLAKIASGILHADSGMIFFNENRINIRSVGAARALGIVAVHQTPSVVEEFDVTQNIFLGNEISVGGRILRRGEMYRYARIMMDKLGIHIDEHTKISCLSQIQRQLILMIKAISQRPRLLILDEMTASLTKHEFEMVRTVLRQIKAEGTSILFISHKIDEVMSVADRVTVLYDGATMGTYDIGKCDRKTIFTAMTNGANVGPVLKVNYSQSSQDGKVILEARGISAPYGVKRADLVLKKNEVLGIAGIVGSGRTTLLKLLFGIVPKVSGDIYICGSKDDGLLLSPRLRRHMGLMPEEYLNSGLFENMNVSINIVIGVIDRCTHWGIVDMKKARSLAEYYINKLGIKVTDWDTTVKNLSGGNKQRVMLGRYMAYKPDILMLDEPMKGIDETARADIVKYINTEKMEGRGIIITSEEPQELIAVCDRILIMKNGTITDEFAKGQVSEVDILNAIT